MWYEFSQNNSGGWFDDKVGRSVQVEADNADEANERAGYFGIYFDDDFDIDCPCCGNRWCRAWGNGKFKIDTWMSEEFVKIHAKG